MIDTHAHLADDIFDGDRDAVVAEAQAAGVSHCVVVGETPWEAEAIRNVCERYAGWAHGCLGLFPGKATEASVAAFERMIGDGWVGLGEIGLDTWIVKDEAERAYDEKVFCHLISLARRYDLPVNVHSRNCGRRAIELLISSGHKKVHMHAFEAKSSTVKMGIEAGFYFSIPVSILHSPQKQKMALQVPLSQLMLETDSPVLGPERTGRNEPRNLVLALEAVAKLRDMQASELESILDANVHRLYGI